MFGYGQLVEGSQDGTFCALQTSMLLQDDAIPLCSSKNKATTQRAQMYCHVHFCCTCSSELGVFSLLRFLFRGPTFMQGGCVPAFLHDKPIVGSLASPLVRNESSSKACVPVGESFSLRQISRNATTVKKSFYLYFIIVHHIF